MAFCEDRKLDNSGHRDGSERSTDLLTLTVIYVYIFKASRSRDGFVSRVV